MAYCTVDEVKAYLGIDAAEEGDDALLATLAAAAQAAIERYTGRTFEASADATRYFCVGEDTQGRVLILDRDLCQITSIVTNADAPGGGTTLQESDYRTRPRNEAPYYAIVLAAGADVSWTYSEAPEDGVAITGRWAWSVTAPADIQQAALRLTAWLYRQKDAQVFDVTAQVATGTLTLPQGLPRDVRQLLDPYVRLV